MNDDDLKKLWKGQAVSSDVMTVEQLRRRATRFQRRVARRNALEYAACIGVVAWFASYVVTFPYPLIRIGSLLLILATGFVAWQLRVRATNLSSPAETGERSWLAFHCEQLERQCKALRSVWLWYVAPFIPGLVVFRWGVEAELDASAPFARGLWANVSIAAIFIAVAAINRYAARRCHRRLVALRRMAVDAA